MDGRTDTEGYNIIPRHTLVAGYKKVSLYPCIADITFCHIKAPQALHNTPPLLGAPKVIL